MTELIECLARRARQRVELEDAALRILGGVEEGTELGARELGPRVGHFLEDVLELQRRGEHRPRALESREDPILIFQRLVLPAQVVVAHWQSTVSHSSARRTVRRVRIS
jgi:hypothetical protein